MDDSTFNETKTPEEMLYEVSKIVDLPTLIKIFNKLTDYAEILTMGKLSGIVNFNYRLNSEQTNQIIDFLLEIQALSKIHNLSFKGTKDLEDEFVSNIFSDVISTGNISSFINIRNLIENRLTHQIQQYNINMGKTNTTMAMPLNELRGHAKTYRDLSKNNLAISTKAQHGIISASLHDAYITLINKNDWWNDKTYMKFFFNEDDSLKRSTLILSRKERVSLAEVKKKIDTVIEMFEDIKASKSGELDPEFETNFSDQDNYSDQSDQSAHPDKMLLTPFGRQYGSKIDTIISDIFNNEPADISEELIEKISSLYTEYEIDPQSIHSQNNSGIIEIIDKLIITDTTVRTFSETYIHGGRSDSFNRFYTEGRKEKIEEFITELFIIYFNKKFQTLFTVIKSPDMRKFACAYTIKRMYVKFGENITRLGYYFIRAIARVGGIKGQ